MTSFAKAVALAICTLSFMIALPASAFEAKTLESVVSLLPDWPSQQPLPKAPEGTAVAIFPDGYLATNAHVLGAAKTAQIRLNDGRLVAAEIIGRDGATDLALIKVAVDFPVLKKSLEPALGSPVCAVGNQFGLGLSVTCGVVSALRRTGVGFNPIEDFIQTDAVINPGGSGGALVDEQGELVGLVSAIFTKGSDSNIGINFATSGALVYRVLEDLRDFGKVVRVKSGFQVRALNVEQKGMYSGARVTHIKQDSAASIAGMQVDDIITRIGKRAVQKPSDVPSAFQLHRPGQTIPILFLRGEQAMEAILHL